MGIQCEWESHSHSHLYLTVVDNSYRQSCTHILLVMSLHQGPIINPLKGRDVNCLHLVTDSFNFWHSGTLALSSERRSAQVSEIDKSSSGDEIPERDVTSYLFTQLPLNLEWHAHFGNILKPDKMTVWLYQQRSFGRDSLCSGQPEGLKVHCKEHISIRHSSRKVKYNVDCPLLYCFQLLCLCERETTVSYWWAKSTDKMIYVT